MAKVTIHRIHKCVCRKSEPDIIDLIKQKVDDSKKVNQKPIETDDDKVFKNFLAALSDVESDYTSQMLECANKLIDIIHKYEDKRDDVIVKFLVEFVDKE